VHVGGRRGARRNVRYLPSEMDKVKVIEVILFSERNCLLVKKLITLAFILDYST
jgi:hypothetical protein